MRRRSVLASASSSRSPFGDEAGLAHERAHGPGAISAGRTKQTSARPIQSNAPGAAARPPCPISSRCTRRWGLRARTFPPDATAGPFLAQLEHARGHRPR